MAIARVGTATKLADELGISPSAISLWDRVPPDRILDVERITGVSRFELRPDICGSDPRLDEVEPAPVVEQQAA